MGFDDDAQLHSGRYASGCHGLKALKQSTDFRLFESILCRPLVNGDEHITGLNRCQLHKALWGGTGMAN